MGEWRRDGHHRTVEGILGITVDTDLVKSVISNYLINNNDNNDDNHYYIILKGRNREVKWKLSQIRRVTSLRSPTSGR